MSFIAWIILGFIAGAIATRLYGGNGGCPGNIVLGVAGAVVSGFTFRYLTGAALTGFNIWSLLVAVIGASLVLGIVNALKGRTPPAR